MWQLSPDSWTQADGDDRLPSNRPTGGMYQPYIYNQHLLLREGGYSITGVGGGGGIG